MMGDVFTVGGKPQLDIHVIGTEADRPAVDHPGKGNDTPRTSTTSSRTNRKSS